MLELTERKRAILRSVVEEYVQTGQPVGSRTLVERAELGVSPSTVRNELAELESLGLLTHPHTSAGRVPTERAYRFYADQLLSALEPRPASFPLERPGARSEIEAALQQTTEMLAELTRLLALVSAPPLETARVRHVEVLLLQPRVALVVVITSAGGVTKHVVEFEAPVDRGLAEWARAYLNETVAGLRLGSHQLRRRLEDPQLTAGERAFLDSLRPAFVEALEDQGRQLYVGGAASLLGGARAEDLEAAQHLLELLERRAAVLALLSGRLDSKRPFVRVGSELEGVEGAALVGATYGLSTRQLGSVGLLGPQRMDYDKAIRVVRAAAAELSRLVEEVYEEN